MTWTPQTQCFVLFFWIVKLCSSLEVKRLFCCKRRSLHTFFKLSIWQVKLLYQTLIRPADKNKSCHIFISDVILWKHTVCVLQSTWWFCIQPFHRVTRKGKSMEERLRKDKHNAGRDLFFCLCTNTCGRVRSRADVIYVMWRCCYYRGGISSEWKQITVVFFYKSFSLSLNFHFDFSFGQCLPLTVTRWSAVSLDSLRFVWKAA